MKTIIALAVGFFLGRQIYIKYDKQTALNKEKSFKIKIKKLLEDKGISGKEADKLTDFFN